MTDRVSTDRVSTGDAAGLSRRSVMLCSLGLATAATSAWGMRRPAAPTRGVNLEGMIPLELGAWRQDRDAVPVLPDEEQERSVADAYDAWMARVYRRPDGKAVMLVLAYGNGNSRTIAVHRPETCYSAQGFTVTRADDAPLPRPFDRVEARRLIAIRETRVEPMIFWMTIAGRQEDFGIGQNLALLRAAWRGQPADAFLIRASTVEADGFPLVDLFLKDMLGALAPPAANALGVRWKSP